MSEGDALAEAQAWRDRLEAQQSDAEHQLDAAREEVSELQAQASEGVFCCWRFFPLMTAVFAVLVRRAKCALFVCLSIGSFCVLRFALDRICVCTVCLCMSTL